MKISHEDFSKMAQSGHTVGVRDKCPGKRINDTKGYFFGEIADYQQTSLWNWHMKYFQ